MSRVAAALLATLLAACAEGPGPVDAGPPLEARVELRGPEGQPLGTLPATAEPLELVLRVRNSGPTPLRVPLTSAQTHDFAVLTADGQELWRWSAGRRFAQVLGELELAPGEEQVFRGRWEPGERAGLTEGSYRIAGWLAGGLARAEVELQVR